MSYGSGKVLSSNKAKRTGDAQEEPDGEEQTRGHHRRRKFNYLFFFLGSQ